LHAKPARDHLVAKIDDFGSDCAVALAAAIARTP